MSHYLSTLCNYHKRLNKVLFICLSLVYFAFGQANTPHADTTTDNVQQLPTSIVKNRQDHSTALQELIPKTESLTEDDLRKSNASTLAHVLDKQPGISTNTGCSMCAIKRVRINGLRGEHTTVLVDDIPLHSTVSGFYGYDAMATAGVSQIDIMRGAGASLLAPEAIGGVINVQMLEPTSNSVFLDAAMGNNDLAKLNLVTKAVTDDQSKSMILAAQYNEQGQWDADENGVNESPALRNYSLNSRFNYRLNERNRFTLGLAAYNSQVFGGPVTSRRFWAVKGGDDAEQAEAFENGDVRKKNIGQPWGYTEAIYTDRQEALLRWKRITGTGGLLDIALSGARQIQESMYEGTDYHNLDQTTYAVAKWSIPLGAHTLTLGADNKYELMQAQSSAFFTRAENGGIIDPDDFEFLSFAFFAQNIWSPSSGFDIKAALRVDKITTDWLAKSAQENEIDALMIAPRIHIRYSPAPFWVLRAGAGRGYRAPLSFFESEHGLTETGYDINISELEDSWGGNASLSFDNARTTATLSYGYTTVKNIATYEDINNRLTLINNKDQVSVQTIDGVIGYAFTQWLTLGLGAEQYLYDDAYKSSLPVAAIEQRLRASLDLEFEQTGTEWSTTVNMVGERDLSEYGYEDRYNIFTEENGPSAPQTTTAPRFFTLDTRLNQRVSDNFLLYVGVENALNYTQAGTDNVSPLFWDEEGGFDVGHIYGPLRGREISAGLQIAFE
jgi:outer membrane receptor for ferrienterochelin and colicins